MPLSNKFSSEAIDFIKEEIERKKNLIDDDKVPSKEKVEQLEKINEAISDALIAFFGLNFHTGNFERILQALNFLDDFQSSCPNADMIFESFRKTVVDQLIKIKDYCNDFTYEQYIRSGSVFGCIPVAKNISFAGQNEYNSSLTTDGTYLYILIGTSGRAGMHKIGTGENGTIAGKVYTSVEGTIEGDVTWVFCKKKLYLRKANEELGKLHVYDSETFKFEGEIKLFCGDVFKKPGASQYNRYYPLLSDGESLFIVAIDVEQRKREIKEGMEEQHSAYLKEKARIRQEKKAAREKRKQEDKSNELKKQKSRSRGGRGGAPPQSNDRNNLPTDIPEEPSMQNVKVCAFKLYKFDVSCDFESMITTDEAMTNDLARELYDSFSGFYSFKECYKSMKLNQNDAEASARWLVDDGEKERGQKILIVKEGILLSESIVVQDNISRKNEHDLIMQDQSILQPNNVQAGFWSMNKDYISFHFNHQTKLFSTNPEKVQKLDLENNRDQAAPQTINTFNSGGFLGQQFTQSRFGISDQSQFGMKREVEALSYQLDSSITGKKKTTAPPVAEKAPKTTDEKDFYEPFHLYGTYIRSINNNKVVEYNHQVTYDHVYQKYYLMMLSPAQQKMIAVAHDYEPMGAIHKETLTKSLKGYDMKDIIEHIKDLDKSKGFKELKTQMIHFFVLSEQFRFTLPWRWRNWDTLYNQVASLYINDTNALFGGGQQNQNKGKKKNSKYQKLLQRADHVRQKGSLDSKKLFPNYELSEKCPLSLSELKSLISEDTTYTLTGVEWQREDVLNTYSSTNKFMNSSTAPQENLKWMMPKSRIEHKKETKKTMPFCINGSIKSLKLIYSNLQQLQSQENSQDVLLWLQLLKYWVIYSDLLVIEDQEGDKKLVEEVSKLLQEMIKNTNVNNESKQLLWNIVILGWDLFCATAPLAYGFLNLLLAYHRQEPTNAKSYFGKLFDPKNDSLHGLYLKFCYYPGGFFPTAALKQVKVNNYQMMVGVPEAKKGEKEEKEITFATQTLRPIVFHVIKNLEPDTLEKFLENNKQFSQGQIKEEEVKKIEKKDEKSSKEEKKVSKIDFREFENQMTCPSHSGAPLHLYLSQNHMISEINLQTSDIFNLEKILQIYTNEDQKELILKYIKENPSVIEEADKQLAQREAVAKQLSEKLEKTNPTKKAPAKEEEKSEKDLENDKFIASVKRYDTICQVTLEKILDEHRALQISSAKELYTQISQKVLDCIDDKDEERVKSTWGIFSLLMQHTYFAGIEENFTPSDLSQNTIIILDFLEKGFELVQQQTNGYKEPVKSSQWFLSFQDFALMSVNLIIITLSFPQVDEYLSHKCLQQILKIVHHIKRQFEYQDPNKASSFPISVIDSAYSLFSEGVDFTNEKVFETQITASKGDVVQRESFSFPSALAVCVEVEQKSSVDNSNDTLTIMGAQQDHGQFINESFMNKVTLPHRPSQKAPMYFLGQKVTLEYRSVSPKKKGQQQPQGNIYFKCIIRPVYGQPQIINWKTKLAEVQNALNAHTPGGQETLTKWEFALNSFTFLLSKLIQPLLIGESIISATLKDGQPTSQDPLALFKQNEGNDKNKDEQTPQMQFFKKMVYQCASVGSISQEEVVKEELEILSVSIKELREVDLNQEFKLTEETTKAPEKKTYDLDLKKINPQLIAGLEQLEKKQGLMYELVKRVRSLTPYPRIYNVEKMRPSFKKVLPQFENLENQITLAFIYHSSSYVRDWNLFFQQESGPSMGTESKLQIVGQHVNSVLTHLFSRIEGEKQFQNMIGDIISESQSYIQEFLTEKLEKEKKLEEQKKIKEVEDKEKALKAKEEEDKKKLEDKKKEEEEKKLEEDKKKPKVPIVQNKFKKKNVKRMFQNIPEKKKKKDNKKGKKEEEVKGKEESKEPSKDDKNEETKTPEVKEEESKEEIPLTKQKIPISDAEMKDLRSKIYSRVYDKLLEFFSGNTENIRALCNLLEVRYNPDDANESLKYIFRHARQRVKPVIDFDGDSPIMQKLDEDLLQNENPYLMSINSTYERTRFLFELNPSIEHYLTLTKEAASMQHSITSALGYPGVDKSEQSSSGLSQGDDGSQVDSKKQTLSELSLDDDELEPLGVGRSKSLQYATKQGSKQEREKKDELKKWVDSYRRSNKRKKGQGEDDQENNSPAANLLKAIVSFLTSTYNPLQIQENCKTHQRRAALRAMGMMHHGKLLQTLHSSPFARFMLGSITEAFESSPFAKIEACGIELSRKIMDNNKILIKRLMNTLINDFRHIAYFIKVLNRSTNLQTKTATSNPTSSNNQQSQQSQSLSKTKIKIVTNNSTHNLHDFINQHLKHMLLTLNDVRVLLNDPYARDSILEILKKQSMRNEEEGLLDNELLSSDDKKQLGDFPSGLHISNETLATDLSMDLDMPTVHQFLNSIVVLIIQSQSTSDISQTSQSSARLNTSISQACRLIIGQFIFKENDSFISNESRKTVQEILLKILVGELEKELGSNFYDPLSFDKLSCLIQLINQVLHMTKIQSVFQSDMLLKTAQIITFIVLNYQAPILIRQVIPTAKILFHQVDMRKVLNFKSIQQVSQKINSESIWNSITEAADKGLSKDNFFINSFKKLGEYITITDDKTQRFQIKEDKVYAYMNINNQEDDFSFILTALYHWEEQFPTFSAKLPTNLAEYRTFSDARKRSQQQAKADIEAQVAQNSNSKKPASSYHYRQVPTSIKKPLSKSAGINGLTQLQKVYDEIIKLTEEEFKESDTPEETQRKVNEKVFNYRVRKHIKQAINIGYILQIRGFAAYPKPLSKEQANKLAIILEKSYKGELAAIPQNVFMKPVPADKKLSNNKEFPSNFPLTVKNTQTIAQLKQSQPGQGPQIIIAPNQLVITLLDPQTAKSLESQFGSTSIPSSLKQMEKNQTEGFSCQICNRAVRSGGSLTLLIEDFIQLFRKVLTDPEQESDKKLKKLIMNYQDIVKVYLNEALKMISQGKWKEITKTDKQILFGILTMVAGWMHPIRSGATVQAFINNQWKECTVINGGHGSGKNSANVILKDDDKFNLIKVQMENIRPLQKILWPASLLPDKKLLCDAMIQMHKEFKEEDIEKYNEEDGVMTSQFLFEMLLKISSKIKWEQEDQQLFQVLLEVLGKISAECQVDKTPEYWQGELLQAWERCVDKLEPGLTSVIIHKPQSDDRSESRKLEATNQVDSSLPGVNPLSCYMGGLPQSIGKTASAEYPLKLLAHWEKYVFPKLLEYVKGTFSNIEIELSFEQVRHSLRKSDFAKAFSETNLMWDQKIPPGMIPGEDHNWAGKVVEQCVVGTYALSKIKAVKSGVMEDTNYPLLNKFINYSMEQIPIIIKSVDFRTNLVLGQYIDSDTLQSQMIILPISSLNSPEKRFKDLSNSHSLKELRQQFSQISLKINAYNARQTLLQIRRNESQISNQNSMKLSDFISWSVWDHYSSDPIKGWTNDLEPVIQIGAGKKRTDISLAKGVTMQNFVEDFVIQEVQKELLSQQKEGDNKLNVIRDLFDHQVNENNLSEISTLVDHCKDLWNLLQNKIKNSQVSVELVSEYDKVRGKNEKLDENIIQSSDESILLPLHQLVNSVSSEDTSGSIATVIVFKQKSHLAAASKVKFYSDQDGIGLLSEINAGQEGKNNLPPVILKDGQVWCYVDFGTTALLPIEQQATSKSELPATICQIPQEWIQCCWLTETLTTSLVNSKEKKQDALKLIQSLTRAMCEFHTESNAPTPIRKLLANLINRCIRKSRHLLLKGTKSEGSHLERLGLNDTWMKSFINEIQELRNQEFIGTSTLFSAYIQDGIDLLLSAMISNHKNETILNVKQIIPDAQLEDWLEAVINSGYIMNYFCREGCNLTTDMKNEIFQSLKIKDQQFEKTMVVRNLPKTLTREQILSKLKQIIKANGGRLLKPSIDIVIPSDDQFNDRKSYLKSTLTSQRQASNRLECLRSEITSLKESHSKTKEERDKIQREEEAKRKKIEEEKGDKNKNKKEDAYTTPNKEAKKEDKKDNKKDGKVKKEIKKEVKKEDKKSKFNNEKQEKKVQEEIKKEQEKPEEKPEEKVQEQPKEIPVVEEKKTIIPDVFQKRDVLKIVDQKLEEEIEIPEDELEKYNHNQLAIVILDGWDVLVFEEEEEEDSEEEEEKKAPEPPAQPAMWNCAACTLENPFGIDTCEICGTPKPANASPPEPEIDNSGGLDLKKQEEKQKKKDKKRMEKIREALEQWVPDITAALEKDKKEEEVLVGEMKAIHEEQDQWIEKDQKKREAALAKQAKESPSPKKKEEEKKSAEVKEEEEKGDAPNQASPEAANPEPKEGSDSGEENSFNLEIDPSIIAQEDPDLAEAMMASMMEFKQQQKEQKDKERKERKAQEKKAADEEKKRKKEEEEKKRAEEGKEDPNVRMLVGSEILNDNNSLRYFQMVLKARLGKTKDLYAKEFEFAPEVISLIAKIHSTITTPDYLVDFPESDLLVGLEFNSTSVKSMSQKEFLEALQQIVECDAQLVWKIFESLGIDLWLDDVAFTHIQQFETIELLKLGYLEQLRRFIEVDLCKETKSVLTLQPTAIRLVSRPTGLQWDEKESPINHLDDSQLEYTYPDLSKHLSIKQLRYFWSLLKLFNKNLSLAIPYINCMHSTITIPRGAIVMNFSSLISCARDIVLSNIKIDLRHNILEKTSVGRDSAPKLYFERLKMAQSQAQGKKEQNAGQSVPPPAIDNRFSSGLYKQPELVHQASSQRISRSSSSRGAETFLSRATNNNNNLPVIEEVNDEGQDSKAQNEKQSDQNNEEPLQTMFIQAWKQIEDLDLTLLRPRKPQGAEPHLSFQIIFKGEHVVGEGGPYRQFFTDVSGELQPTGGNSGYDEEGKGEEEDGDSEEANRSQKSYDSLCLLCPTPNNKEKQMLGKDKWVINPTANQSEQIAQFEFLGILMGVCIRTGARLTLDLPGFIWKQIVGQSVSIVDLEEIDTSFVKMLDFLRQVEKDKFDETFKDFTWSIKLSDGSQHDLIKGGSEKQVDFESRLEFIEKALKARIMESSQQCQAIVRGIAKIVPIAILNLVTFSELETWVCGKKEVDIELLRRHTKFGGDKKFGESNTVIYFWEVLEQMSNAQRLMFIKFCWGQERLPANDEEFDRTNTRFMIKPTPDQKEDDRQLPKADTCFFNFMLPNYSSAEVMKERILKAIYLDSDSMNAEDNNPMMENPPVDYGDDDYYDEF